MKKIIKVKALSTLLFFSLIAICYSENFTLTDKNIATVMPTLVKLTAETKKINDRDIKSKLKVLLKKIENMKNLEEHFSINNTENFIKELESTIAIKKDYIKVIEGEMQKARDANNIVSIAKYEEDVTKENEVIAKLNGIKKSFQEEVETYKKTLDNIKPKKTQTK